MAGKLHGLCFYGFVSIEVRIEPQATARGSLSQEDGKSGLEDQRTVLVSALAAKREHTQHVSDLSFRLSQAACTGPVSALNDPANPSICTQSRVRSPAP